MRAMMVMERGLFCYLCFSCRCLNENTMLTLDLSVGIRNKILSRPLQQESEVSFNTTRGERLHTLQRRDMPQ